MNEQTKIAGVNKTGDTRGEIVVRKISLTDAEAAADLSRELGYPAPVEEMESRIRELEHRNDHVAYVACLNDNVVGWIDVGIVHHLQSNACGEIGGLVVGGQYQGRGIGKMLVRKAEEWVAGQNIRTILVRSQIKREAAHRFYLQQNFSHWKTSAVFTKSLPHER